MRIFSVLLVIVLLGGGAGYTFYWHKEADALKQTIVETIDNINTQTKPLTVNKSLVTYEAVNMTGFPFDMVAEITKPVVTLPLSKLTKKPGASPAPYDWTEEVSYGDKITLTRNVWGNKFTVTTNGDRTNKSFVNGQLRHGLVTSSSTPFTCKLEKQLAKGTMPWTMEPIFTDVPNFAATFRSFGCETQNLVSKDANGRLLLTTDHISYLLSQQPDNGINHIMGMKIDFGKLKAEPAFDVIYKDYLLMLYTLNGDQDLVKDLPVVFSEYGDQNALIDIAYDGPTDNKYLTDPGLNMHFDINAFNFHSALSNMDLEMHYANAPQGTDRIMSLALHSKMNATQRAYDLGKQGLVYALNNMTHAQNMSPQQMQFAQMFATLGSPTDIANTLVPNLPPLGTLSLDFDTNLKIPNQKAAMMMQNMITVDDLDLLATPYGIKVKGSGGTAGPGKRPNADFTITCISCDALIRDAGGYAMRVEALLNKASKKQPFLNSALLQGVTQFLHGVSENAAAKDLVIHLTMKDTGFTVSGKQVPEVLALYMSTIAPVLQPAAGGSAQPEPAPMRGPQ